MNLLIILTCLGLAAAAAPGQTRWLIGGTEGFLPSVITKDPAGELEQKTRYLAAEELAPLGEVDGREVRFPAYCVLKFTEPGRYRVQLTCRADGNHQVLVFSPSPRATRGRDFREVVEPRTITIDFDAGQSRHLVMNCTRGSLYLDALTVEPLEEAAGPPPSTRRPALLLRTPDESTGGQTN